MTDREYFIKRFFSEHPIFLRLFEALPEERLDYRPHPRSMSAKELVGSIVGDEITNLVVIKSGEFNWKGNPGSDSNLREMITEFKKIHKAVGRYLKKVDGRTWRTKKAKFYVHDQFAYEEPLGDFLWGCLFDQIHHRGQLSTYIRPMGGKVPSIYGPSGDDPG